MPTDPLSIPLYGGGPPQAARTYLDTLGASQAFVNQASWEEASDTSITPWIGRAIEQSRFGSDQDSPMLSADVARQRLQRDRLSLEIPDSGIREATFDKLVARQYAKRAHQDAMDRGPDGFLSGAQQFSIGLARQALDPLNIAAAFIPVVGEGRIAMMLEAAGAGMAARAGVRAQIGAIEGLVGTAALEPGMHFLAGQLQEDYTMADSLLNVAFGGLIGGGLHIGVGTVADWRKGVGRGPDAVPDVQALQPQGELPSLIQGMPVEDRRHIGAIALAQAIDGRDVDVAGVLDGYRAKRAELIAAERAQIWEAMFAADEATRAIDVPAIRDTLAGTEIKPGFLRSAEELLAARQEARQRATPGFLQTALDKLALRELDTARSEVADRIEGKVQEAIADERAKINQALAAEVAQAKGQRHDSLLAIRRDEIRTRTELARQDTGVDRELAVHIKDLMERKPRLLAEELAEAIDHYQLRAELLASPDRLAKEAAARDLTPLELQRKLERMQQRASRDMAVYREAGFPLDTMQQIRDMNRLASERVHESSVKGQGEDAGVPREAVAAVAEAERLLDEYATVDPADVTTAIQRDVQDALHELKTLTKDEPVLAEEDAAIAQAADDAKILTAMAACRVRKG